MKKLLIGLFISVLLLGCAQMSAEDIAKNMQEKYESIEDMKGTMVTTTYFEGGEQTHKVDFAMKNPHKYWSDGVNQTIVTNGSVLWIYDKRKNEVTRIESVGSKEEPEFDYADVIEEMLQRSEIEIVGSEKVSGRDCFVVEQKPKSEAYYTEQKLWIDKEFWYPLRTETSYGEFNATMEYRDMEFNTGIDDSKFEFTPPEGAKVIKREYKAPEKLTVEEVQDRVSFDILSPGYTAGYEFSHAVIRNFGERELVALYFEKDDETLVINEQTVTDTNLSADTKNVEIGGEDGELIDMVTARMLRFTVNETEVIISGKLGEVEIVKVAESMI